MIRIGGDEDDPAAGYTQTPISCSILSPILDQDIS